MLLSAEASGIGTADCCAGQPVENGGRGTDTCGQHDRKNKRKKEQLQAELEGRQLDANIGGMTRRKIITAYRERVIRLACILEREGKISLAELRARGLEELAVLLGRNYEKWFVRVEKGVYALSGKRKNRIETGGLCEGGCILQAGTAWKK